MATTVAITTVPQPFGDRFPTSRDVGKFRINQRLASAGIELCETESVARVADKARGMFHHQTGDDTVGLR